MKTFRFLAAALAVALGSLSIGTAVASTHRAHPASINLADTSDLYGARSYCAYLDGQHVVAVGAAVHRSSDRTTNLTWEATIEYDSGGNHYSGTVFTWGVSTTPTSPGNSPEVFATLTTNGPTEFTGDGSTALTTATNIVITFKRVSDSEVEGSSRSRNVTTACS